MKSADKTYKEENINNDGSDSEDSECYESLKEEDSKNFFNAPLNEFIYTEMFDKSVTFPFSLDKT